MTLVWNEPIIWDADRVVDDDDLNDQLSGNLDYLAGNYPIRSFGMHLQSRIEVGDDLVTSIRTGQAYNATWHQDNAQDGDTFVQEFVLGAGTYTLHILGVLAANAGIVDWYLDDVSIATGQDWYGSLTLNTENTVSGVVISEHARVELKAVINGQHASSSGYYLDLTALWFQQ